MHSKSSNSNKYEKLHVNQLLSKPRLNRNGSGGDGDNTTFSSLEFLLVDHALAHFAVLDAGGQQRTLATHWAGRDAEAKHKRRDEGRKKPQDQHDRDPQRRSEEARHQERDDPERERERRDNHRRHRDREEHGDGASARNAQERSRRDAQVAVSLGKLSRSVANQHSVNCE